MRYALLLLLCACATGRRAVIVDGSDDAQLWVCAIEGDHLVCAEFRKVLERMAAGTERQQTDGTLPPPRKEFEL